MTWKVLEKLLKEFPWLWALHSEWSPYNYDHIYIVRNPTAGNFSTVINENYQIKKIWVKVTRAIDQVIYPIPVVVGETIASNQSMIELLSHFYYDINAIAVEKEKWFAHKREEKALIIYTSKKNNLNKILRSCQPI